MLFTVLIRISRDSAIIAIGPDANRNVQALHSIPFLFSYLASHSPDLWAGVPREYLFNGYKHL